MHFLPDVYVACEVCGGRRYNRETLEVAYKGASIADVLDMTVDQARRVPRARPGRPAEARDAARGRPRLPRPSASRATTLSGGEAQRVKLCRELARRGTGRTLYILDEPTTGLHFADIQQLLEVLDRLVEAGNTVIVIEHNLDVIKSADYVIDLGPEGGDGGGGSSRRGRPRRSRAPEGSHTGRDLREILAR